MCNGDIKFKDVEFAYDSRKPALNGLNKRRKTVDLPPPDSPTNAVVVPGLQWKVRPFNAGLRINAERLLELFREQPTVVDSPRATPLAMCNGDIKLRWTCLRQTHQPMRWWFPAYSGR
jgi:hypothetical protein